MLERIDMRECENMKDARRDLEKYKLFSPPWWRLSGTIKDHKADCDYCEK